MTQVATYPSLNGKTVVVTGGGSGIGEAIVTQFARQGCKVGFLDIAEDASNALVASLQAEGLEAMFVQADLTDIAATVAAIDTIRAAYGPIGVLVNNAAHDQRHALEDITPDYFDDRIAVNVKHQLFASQAVMEDMKTLGGGAIICMGSTSWMLGQGGMACYTAAKSAVLGLMRSLARDLGPYNIRVNSIAPGWIMTERQKTLWLTPEAEAELMKQQCLKRHLVPDDIAKTVLFFCSDDAGACTNQSYIVDGGWC
ncbi:MAG: SDR family NAD(P)-dependent oxidoreductase [Pseudomonadota bacterium]